MFGVLSLAIETAVISAFKGFLLFWAVFSF